MININKCSRTHYRTFTKTTERTRDLLVIIHLTNRTEFFVHSILLIKRTNVNKLFAERFTNQTLNEQFVANENET
ncbi:hypothetical protein Hanom_Chr05g00473971 [Helianthus anomalus]